MASEPNIPRHIKVIFPGGFTQQVSTLDLATHLIDDILAKQSLRDINTVALQAQDLWYVDQVPVIRKFSSTEGLNSLYIEFYKGVGMYDPNHPEYIAYPPGTELRPIAQVDLRYKREQSGVIVSFLFLVGELPYLVDCCLDLSWELYDSEDQEFIKQCLADRLNHAAKEV